MLNINMELNNMNNITEVDTRFSLSTIRLMHVWVYGCELNGSFDAALMTMKTELGEETLYDMRAKADKVVNIGYQAFKQEIEAGVK
jgi:hypothetical protein|tara:strand:+ start:46 stop:303 length:258 start_codon:yes stop_codon:yes gene_type:complete